MRGLVALAVALLLPATAAAGSAGAGVPEVGGAGAGAASDDARGLFYNPAASVGANGSQVTFDLGVNILAIHYQRAGLNPRGGAPFPGADSFDLAPTPYLAIRSDNFGRREKYRRAGRDESRLGLGFTIAAPFGRRVFPKSEYPGRYHLGKLDYFTVYAIPSIAFRVMPGWRIGAGPILAISQYTLTQRLDLAPELQKISPSNPPPPRESGLLEGQIEVNAARAIEPAFSLGTMVDLGDGVATIGAGFLSGSISNAVGRSKVTPSLDFNVHSKADFKLTRALPPIVNLGARIRPPETPVEISIEGQWVGWHVVREDLITLKNSQIYADDADLQNLLSALNINQGQLVGSILDKKEPVARHWQDSVNLILGAEYKWAPMRSRFEIGYDKSAIPDKNVNPGALDFDTLILGASTTWEPKEKPFSASLAISQYLNQGRTITNSKFDTYSTERGYAYPSGNGTYSAVLTQVRVAFGFRF